VPNLLQRHEDLWESGGIDHHSWPWHQMAVINFTLLPLYYSGKSPGTHSMRRWMGPRTVLDVMGKEKWLIPAGSGSPAVQLVIIPTELSWPMYLKKSSSETKRKDS
jgi:hypothetical protein